MENKPFELAPELAARLEIVAGHPGRPELADKLRKVLEPGYDKEKPEAVRRKTAERAIILALSTPQEEINRFKFLKSTKNAWQMARRSIEVAREAVGVQLESYFSLQAQWYRLPSLDEPPPDKISDEERERNRWRMAVLREWTANGKLLQRDESGRYRYTLADCKAEAARRQGAIQ